MNFNRRCCIKKKILIVVFIAIALFISITIYRSQIPDLKIVHQNTKIEVMKCPFSWDTLLSSHRWDYPTPPELAKEMNAITVEPQSILNLSFTKKPKSFNVSLWNESSEEYPSNNNKIIAPTDKGTYIFAVIGYWDNGQVLYIFKINVT